MSQPLPGFDDVGRVDDDWAPKGTPCPACGESLDVSMWLGSQLKSCTRCSRRYGVHIYYDIDTQMGWRTPSATGETIPQPQCSPCRSNDNRHPKIQARCGQAGGLQHHDRSGI